MRVVIVGLGIQGKKRQRFAGGDLVATVDPYENATKYKDITQVPLDEFDAALICTPDNEKIQIAKYLLGSGKHVLVEKPLLASDRSELLELQELATTRRVICYTAYNHRFEPHIVRLKELLGSGELGNLYMIRMSYGNGTARDVRHSPWRDQGMGVLADLGSHLLDLARFFFGQRDYSFEPWSLNRFENQSFDYVLFGSSSWPILQIEATLLSWRNSFKVDIIGELGSAHIDGLCKWGSSTLTVRKRSFPSGKPAEERRALECADPTWEREYQHFKELCSTGFTYLANDIWINDVLHTLEQRVPGLTEGQL